MQKWFSREADSTLKHFRCHVTSCTHLKVDITSDQFLIKFSWSRFINKVYLLTVSGTILLRSKEGNYNSFCKVKSWMRNNLRVIVVLNIFWVTMKIYLAEELHFSLYRQHIAKPKPLSHFITWNVQWVVWHCPLFLHTFTEIFAMFANLPPPPPPSTWHHKMWKDLLWQGYKQHH